MFFNLEYKPLNIIFKVIVSDLTYIRRLIYLERLELGVLFFGIAMFVVKLTDFITRKHQSTGDFSGTNSLMLGLKFSNKTLSGEDYFRV